MTAASGRCVARERVACGEQAARARPGGSVSRIFPSGGAMSVYLVHRYLAAI